MPLMEKNFKLPNFDIRKLPVAIQLTGILIIGLLFRLFLLRYQFAIAFDEVHYLKLAAAGRDFGLFHVLHVFWSPFYSIVVSLVYRVITNLETAGRLVSIFSGLLIILGQFYYVNKYLNRKAALFSLLWVVLYPPLALLQTTALAESIYMALGLSGIVVGWQVIKEKHWLWSGIPGAIFGFAYLCRPEGMGFQIVFFFLGLSAGIYRYIQGKSKRLILIAVFSSFIFTLVSLPYVYYLHQQTGRWIPSGKISIQQGELYGESREADEVDTFRLLSDDNTRMPVDELFHDGNFLQSHAKSEEAIVKVTVSAILKKYIKNFYKTVKFGVPTALSSVLFLFVVLGLFKSAWNPETLKRNLYLLGFLGFFWFLLIPMFHISERYYLPLLPLCFIWAGEGMNALHVWLQETFKVIFSKVDKYVNPSGAALGIIMLVFIGGSFLPELGRIIIKSRWDRGQWDAPVEQKAAGIWLKNNFAGIPKIMSHFHTVDFYAGNYNIKNSTEIPLNEDMQRVRAYGKQRNIDFLVLDGRYIANNPNMKPIFTKTRIPDFFKLVYEKKYPSGFKIMIFRIL